MTQTLILPPEQRRLVLYNHITYLLYIVSIFTAGLLWIVPIFMNYLFRPQAEDTWLKSHHNWQINTFWGSLVLLIIGWGMIFFGGGATVISAIVSGEFNSIVGASLVATLFGAFVLLIGYVWNLYRIVRGWIALTSKKSVP